MKKFIPGIILFIIVVVLLLICKSSGADEEILGASIMRAIDGQPGCMGEAIAENSDDVFSDGVFMNASDGQNMAVMKFLLQAPENAQVLKVSVQAKSDKPNAGARLTILYGEQKEKQLLGLHFDLNKNGQGNVFYLKPASRYVNEDGIMEVHITVSDGQTIDIGEITLEGLARESVKEIRVVKTYEYYPPTYVERPSIFYAYYVGPYYVYRDYCAYVVYDGWWVMPGYVSWCVRYEPVYAVHPPRTCHISSHWDLYPEANCATVSRHHNDGHFTPSEVIPAQRFRSTKDKTRSERAFVAKSGDKPVGLVQAATDRALNSRGDGYKLTRDSKTKNREQVENRSEVKYFAPSRQPIGVNQQQKENIGRLEKRAKTDWKVDNSPKGPGILDRVRERVRTKVENVVRAQSANSGSTVNSQTRDYRAPQSNQVARSNPATTVEKKRPDPVPQTPQRVIQNLDDDEKNENENKSPSSENRKRKK